MKVWGTLGQASVERPWVEICPTCSPWLNQDNVFGEGSIILITSYQGYILSKRFTPVDANLGHLAEVGFATVNLFFPFPFLPILSSLKERNCAQPTCKGEVATEITWNSSAWGIGLFSKHPVTYLYHYELTSIHFLFWAIHNVTFYFFCSISFDHWKFFPLGSCTPLTYSHHCVGVCFAILFACLLFHFLSVFLLCGSARCSRLILYTSCPSGISHFSEEPWFFFLENVLVLGTKVWVPSVLIASGVSQLLGSLSWQSKETVVYILHVSVSISVRKHLYLR